MMQQTLTNPADFASLKHGALGYCDAHALSAFKFGNQRGEKIPEEFNDLCKSVKHHKGIHTSVGVRFNPEQPDKLELIYGHCRRDAAIETGFTTVPFRFFEVDDDTAYQLHISENFDRNDLDIVAKAKAARTYLSHFKADYEAVASKLNLSVKKVRELLELNKCSDKVLSALRSKTISEGHAILLACFPAEQQDKNLNVIIAEGWTVATLRERSGKAKLPLSRAIFDLADCQECEHNSIHQQDLFSVGDTKAQCAKRACYTEKTTAHLENQKAELTEKYGHILLLSECAKENRNAVSADILGDAQWATCRTCDDKVAVLNDDINKQLGAVLPNQCVNKVCFTDCKTAYEKEVKVQLDAQISDSEKATEAQKANAKAVAKKTAKAKATGTLPTKATESYKSALRAAATTFYADDNRFSQCVLTAAIVSQAKYTDDVIKHARFADALVTCLSLSNEQRAAITQHAITHLLCKTDTDANSSSVTDTLIQCLSVDKATSIEHVTAAWTPTKDNLSVYTADLLPALVKSAGLDKTLGQDAFDKLVKLGKGKMIENILAADHDWSGYAPKSLIQLIAK